MAPAALRLLRVALHLALGVFLSLSPRDMDAARRRWARGLLGALGVRMDAPEAGIAPGTLVVANHVSWLDVFALNALMPACFVAKSEIRAWPLLGWLLVRNNAIFIRRGFNRRLPEVVGAVRARLEGGETVVFFPEGTTSDGLRLLPFRPALFEAAVRAGAPVAAFAIQYHDGEGRHSEAAAFTGGQSLLASLVAIAAQDGLRVRVEARAAWPAPVSRRDACQAAQAAVQEGLRAGRPAATMAPSRFTPAAISTAEA